jgi:pyruvate/2-oxoglutarate dehydrogenase complex dihydrolipoamide dehydrogenase (E3) component
LHIARRADDYGVRIEGAVNVAMKEVKARKDAVVAAFRNGAEQSLKTLQGCTVYEGHGRFVAEKKVAVNDSELAADQIFINVHTIGDNKQILGASFLGLEGDEAIHCVLDTMYA